MPLGQGWLNAWVKVNSKHVVFPPPNNSKSERDSQREDSSHHHHGAKVQTTDKSVATAPTSASEDPEHQAIKRFNSRKNKRRLHRTVSASDLIRANSKGKGGSHENGEPSERELNDTAPLARPSISSTRITSDDTSDSDRKDPSTQYVPQHEDDRSHVSGETDSSLRFVAGFFGADIERYSSGHGDAALAAGRGTPRQKQQARTNNSDTIETASVQLLEMSNSKLDAASVVSRGGQSAPPPRTYTSGSVPQKDDNSVKSQGGLGIRFPPNLFAGDTSSKNVCKNCRQLENDLLTSQEDLEYLRGMALRSEYICSSCDTQPTTRKDGSLTQTRGDSSKESSHTLAELSAVHKNQLEHLTKERAKWQQDTHFKLQKFATLCKELDEEAALRNEEAISLHHELDIIRSERDQLATEVESLRGRVAFFERKLEEQLSLETFLPKYEQRRLDNADSAIQMRDAVINDLSGRLERALDLLVLEREQQRQRRQIIFPSRATNSDGRHGDELEAELRSTKEALRISQAAEESIKHESEKKEVAFLLRIDQLERQLDAARSEQGRQTHSK